ncbi:MAG: 3,4-dihydroxyphenylacetate 2,3-dioxygenase [Thaumarchaeota archaeon]|nr:3,4-dihydroxyphenylacetate 2,3-dioxygenase [Nitrososphaerota archaeon]
MQLNVMRLGHVELRVTDLDKAREFYVGMLGFVETDGDANRIYLRGLEERYHHSVVLKLAPTPGLAHFAFRVGSADDVENLGKRFKSDGVTVLRKAKGEEKGQGEAIRVQDPLGFPVEFYTEMDEVPWMLQEFHLHRGARPARIDHVNIQTPYVQRGFEYYTKDLGFSVTEDTVTDDGKLWAVWLRRKQNVHDIAIMNGTGPRFHHFGVWLPDITSVIRVCDILAGAGMQDRIERGPGRHGVSNAFFVYVRDLDGNRVEFYTGDYMTADPNWKPIRWSLEDKNRGTFWGATPPRSWFDEASPVESIFDGNLVTPIEVISQDRPHFVT